MSEGQLSEIACSKCGELLYEGDVFCGNCGKKVSHCEKCGAIIAEKAKFCIKCGTLAVNKCGKCGAIQPEGAEFCLECGAKLAHDEPSGEVASAMEVGSTDSVPKSALVANAPLCGHSRKAGIVSAVIFCVGLLLGLLLQTYSGTNSATLSAVDCVEGDYVTFGRYPQNNGDKPEPIEWLVLDNDGMQALLLSKYALHCKPFHHENVGISWRDSDLRKWLNSDFMSCAFNSSEQKQIAKSKIYTGNNPKYDTKGCGKTRDKVFCLSIEEAWKYFGNVKENDGCTEKWHSNIADSDWWVNRERACKPTSYAIAHGANQDKYYWKEESKGKPEEWWLDNCWFWLRSPGNGAGSAAYVRNYGAVDSDGYIVSSGRLAVRPALRVKLK